MNERGPSIAESLIAAGALLDERYRLDTLVRRSTTATIHVATHRNGSTVWLKLPVSTANAARMALEGRIANALGAPLVVRDDGKTPNGVPYLVIDPPDAESVATLRGRGRAGTKLPLARIMTTGDALARVVATVHAMGQVTAGLDDEDVLVFTSGDVALLDLHALTPATPARLAADVKHVARVLSALLTDAAETTASTTEAIAGVLAAPYPDVASLQAAWRAAAPEPIFPPARLRSGSLTDIPVSGQLSALETPLSVTVEPLSEPPQMVQPPLTRAARGRGQLVAVVAVPLLALVTGAAFLAAPPDGAPERSKSPATAALQAKLALPEAPAAPPVLITAQTTPAASPPAAIAAASPPAAELDMSTHLRSENAPAGREVLIDGKPVGKTPLDVSVPCGRHALQMVAGAPKQSVHLPCSGQRVVRYDAKGHWSLK